MRKTMAAQQFHAEMLAIYDRCAAFGFRPVLFRRLVILKGGMEAAAELVFKPGTTGLERLAERGQAEFSMEALMLKVAYRRMFDPLAIKEAEKRLAGGSSRDRSRGRLTTPFPDHTLRTRDQEDRS